MIASTRTLPILGADEVLLSGKSSIEKGCAEALLRGESSIIREVGFVRGTYVKKCETFAEHLREYGELLRCFAEMFATTCAVVSHKWVLVPPDRRTDLVERSEYLDELLGQEVGYGYGLAARVDLVRHIPWDSHLDDARAINARYWQTMSKQDVMLGDFSAQQIIFGSTASKLKPQLYLVDPEPIIINPADIY